MNINIQCIKKIGGKHYEKECKKSNHWCVIVFTSFDDECMYKKTLCKLIKKDGNNVVAYSIDGKELGKYLKQESNKNSKGTSNSTLSLDDVNIKSMKGSRTLNDKDLPLKESITLVVENKKKSKTDNNMFSGLTNGKTTVKINVTYKNPGKSVSVTLPKDLSSYKLQKK